MAEIFADTSGWGHLVDSSQSHHRLVASIYREARRTGRKFITTNYILTELVALMASPLRIPRPKIIAFIESLKASSHVEIFHINAQLDAEAWQLLKQRKDKEWSLVDCSSFVLMNQCSTVEAFTTDHHFEQAGFVRLIK